MTTALQLCDVSVHYGTTVAVDHVNLQAEHGDILALLGPSGSGKSSLLRAIAGLEDPASGDIRWEGESVVTTPVHRRGFGLMFQDGQLFAHRTVAGNVAYGLRHLSADERVARVAQMLELVGLADYADRAVTQLSGGQAQRVALARALAPKPRLLLLDEPLSALDRSLREYLATEIRRILHTSHATGIYVTHDQDEAFSVASQIAIMIDGKIARFGTPAEVWDNPHTHEVAAFLGYGPFLRDRQGALRALAPGALHIVNDMDANPAAGDVITHHAEVIDVRPRRGDTDVQIQLGQQQAIARLGQTSDRATELIGQRVHVGYDLASAPIITEPQADKGG
ncbi:MAG: ABC transporter ATP-binding protein [Bowdeniella nasicola]|nr:ABC transporter ATP-binding protein [Bowdeniella nasicola]